MSGDPGDAARAAQERLTEEARATASALLDWLGTRADRAAAPDPSARPSQSPGPCSWCPVCAVVAAVRGEQPELTARLAEQASGLMMLLRMMVQTHQGPGHVHDLADLADLGPLAPEPPGETRPSPGPSDLAADLAAAGLDVPDPHVDPPGTAEEAPARPRGRPSPVRRASPRSAAFRRSPGPVTPPGRPAPRPAAPATPTPVTPEPGPPAEAADTPVLPATVPRRPGPRVGPARPSVQRIAIRRPGRGGEGEADRAHPDAPC